MSGGHYNYACFKTDEPSEALSALEDFKEMERDLRQIGKHDAADEVYDYVLELETCQRHLRRRGKRIYELLRAVEWSFSGDTGPEHIDEAYAALLHPDEDIGT
jgi:hypothetical protein